MTYDCQIPLQSTIQKFKFKLKFSDYRFEGVKAAVPAYNVPTKFLLGEYYWDVFFSNFSSHEWWLTELMGLCRMWKKNVLRRIQLCISAIEPETAAYLTQKRLLQILHSFCHVKRFSSSIFRSVCFPFNKTVQKRTLQVFNVFLYVTLHLFTDEPAYLRRFFL